MAKKANEQDRLSALLASVTEEMFDDKPQSFSNNSIKVERILLEMVRPDPVQPRRVLPEQLHHKFHNNRLTPTQGRNCQKTAEARSWRMVDEAQCEAVLV